MLLIKWLHKKALFCSCMRNLHVKTTFDNSLSQYWAETHQFK